MLSTFAEIGRSALRNKARGLLFRQKRLDSVNKQLEDNYWVLADPENDQNLSKRTARFNDKIESVESEIRSLKKDLKEFPENEELISTIDKFSSTKNNLIRERNKLKLQEAELDRKRAELFQKQNQEVDRINKMQREIDSFVNLQFSPQKMIRRAVLQKGKEEELREAIRNNERDMKQVSYMMRELKALNTVYKSDEIKSKLSQLTDFYDKLSDANNSMEKNISQLRSTKVQPLIRTAAELSSIKQRIKSPSALIRQAIDFYSSSRIERIKNDAQKLREDYKILMTSVTKDIKIGDTKKDIERIKALQEKLENIKTNKYWKILVKRPSGYDKLGFVTFQRELEMNEKELNNMLDVLEHQKSKLKARDCDLLKQRLQIITKAYSEWKTIRKNIRKIYKESRDFDTKQEVALRVLTDERDKVDKILETELTENDRNSYLRLRERIDWELERLTNQWEKSAQRFENITVTALSEYPESIQNVRTRLVNEKRYITTLLEKYCTGLAIPEVRDYAGKVQNTVDRWSDILDEYKEIFEREREKDQELKDKLVALLEESVNKEVEKTEKIMERVNKEIIKAEKTFDNIAKEIGNNQGNSTEKQQELYDRYLKIRDNVSKLKNEQLSQIEKSEQLLRYLNFVIRDAQNLTKIYFSTINDLKEDGYMIELPRGNKSEFLVYKTKERDYYSVNFPSTNVSLYKSVHTHPGGETFSPYDLYSLAVEYQELASDVLAIQKGNAIVLLRASKKIETIESEVKFLKSANVVRLEYMKAYKPIKQINMDELTEYGKREVMNWSEYKDYLNVRKEWESQYEAWMEKKTKLLKIKREFDEDYIYTEIKYKKLSEKDQFLKAVELTKKYVKQFGFDLDIQSAESIEKLVSNIITKALNTKEKELKNITAATELANKALWDYYEIDREFSKFGEQRTADIFKKEVYQLRETIDDFRDSLNELRAKVTAKNKERRWELRNELYMEALSKINEFDDDLDELNSITKEIESIEIPEE